MKNLLFKSSVLGLMAALLLGCGPDPVKPEEPKPEPEPEKVTFEVAVKTVEADYVEIAVKASKEMEMAYLLSTEAQTLTEPVLFVSGTVAKVKDGDVIEIRNGISQSTHYHLYAVAKLDDKNYSEIYDLEFTTKDYEFKEMLTVVDTYHDGFRLHLTIPEATKQRGNAIRYAFGNMALYNVRVSNNGGDTDYVDAESIVFNGNPYGNYLKKDSTFVMTNDNAYLLDANGNPILDASGDVIEIHSPITPGEPTVFIAGECRWGEFDELHKIMGVSFGINDSSYIIPLVDWKTGWSGEFQKKVFYAKQPELSEGTVTVDIPEDEISAVDANIYFAMDKNVSGYFYLVLDDASYNMLIDTYFAGNEDWFQWYLTSYFAYYEWGIGMEREDLHVRASSSFIEPLEADSKYHVVCTVAGDDKAATQRYIHKEFRTKEKTKRAPVIEIKAVESGDPYVARFNVKSTNPESPVVLAYYAANYSREFQLMFNAGYTYETLLKGNNGLTANEIAQLNSPEGLTINVPTLDGEVTRLAVYGCNDEYTFNKIDKNTEGSGWADYIAPMAPAVDMIDSPYYYTLEDDWTATARVSILVENPDGTIVPKEIEYKSKVNIGNEIAGIPDQVEELVYPLYGGKSRAEVDGMFAELKMLADRFAEYRLFGQNRMICNGFFDYDYYDTSRMMYMSPYDLFKAKDYSSVDVPQLLYDFGPKWYIEVQKDGSLLVPFNSSTMPPMHAWPGYPFYLGGVGNGTAFIDANEQYPGFPVEVSADNNTITIKPFVFNGQSYYMNAIGINGSSTEIIASVISDIVLTRGWTETGSKSASYEVVPTSVKAMSLDGRTLTELPKARVLKSLTGFEDVKPLRNYKKAEKANFLTKEQLDITTQKILNYEINY